MEVEVEYTGSETERKLAELEHKTRKQTIEISDELLKAAIERGLVSFYDGLLRREYSFDSNGNLRHAGHSSYSTQWKYEEWGRMPEILAEQVRVKEIEEREEKERAIQKQEQEKRAKEVEAKKNEARELLAEEITALNAEISELSTEVKKYKDREEREKKQAEEREKQEKIRKIEAKGFKPIEWDGEKYKEVPEDLDEYETRERLERIQLVDDYATAEMWIDRDTEETITVFSAAGKYFV
jgi:hypothetical protein